DGEIPDFAGDGLAFGRETKINERFDFSAWLASQVEEKRSGQRIRAALHRSVIRRYCGCASVLFNSHNLDALGIGGATIANPIFLLGDGVNDRRSARQGLCPWAKICALKHFIFKENVGSRAVFTRVGDDLSIAAADVPPIASLTGENTLKL